MVLSERTKVYGSALISMSGLIGANILIMGAGHKASQYANQYNHIAWLAMSNIERVLAVLAVAIFAVGFMVFCTLTSDTKERGKA